MTADGNNFLDQLKRVHKGKSYPIIIISIYPAVQIFKPQGKKNLTKRRASYNLLSVDVKYIRTSALFMYPNKD